jgi:hypothetical protein
MVAIAWGATPAGGKADVFVAVSRDAGATFGPPVRVNATEGEPRLGGELPPRVVILPPRAGQDAEVVVAYGAKNAATEIKVARSRDGGRTFLPAESVSAPGAAGDRGWHAMTLDAAGRAHVMWLDHRGLAARKAESHAHREAAAMDGAAMAQLSGLYYWPGAGAERELAKGVCFCCKVAMTAAPGGAIFAAWRHVYPGNIRDIAFTVSRDGGRTFTAPARASADQWQLAGCPDDGPAVTTDAQGTLHLVWPTVIGGDQPEGAIFYASSGDGTTFSPRQRVPTLGAPRPMHPQIAVTGSGALMVAWDEVIDGVRQAAWRSVTIDAGGRPVFGEAHRLGAAGASSSYPMIVATAKRPLAIWVDAGRIAVESLGR